MEKSLSRMVPLSCEPKTESLYVVDRDDFLFDTEFPPYYERNNLRKKVSFSEYVEQVPSYDVKDKKFITLFHITRCRSTLLIQDLYHSGLFNVINEVSPFIMTDDGPDIRLMDKLIDEGSREKHFCHKVGLFYNRFPKLHMEKYPNSLNYFLYRDPKEVMVSNLQKKNKMFQEIHGKSVTSEMLAQISFLINTYARITPFIEDGSVKAISYEEIGDFRALERIQKDFDFTISEKGLKKIREKRNFHSHRSDVEFRGSTGESKKLHEKYAFNFKVMDKKSGLSDIYNKFLDAVEKNK